MKRLHLHLGVSDLPRAVAFYSELFATAPTVSKPDYAKWRLDDPMVNFALSTRVEKGLDHLGIDVENDSELDQVRERILRAGAALLEEEEANCCYARSRKHWTADPDGTVWESFLTHDAASNYGEGPDVRVLREAGAAR